jgi:Flp pilus assembly protein TadD
MKTMTIGEILTRARNAFKMGEFPLVERLAMRILESEPQSAVAYNLLGSVCEKTARFRKAIDLFQKAVILERGGTTTSA